jgi:signal transduction histidine kinase
MNLSRRVALLLSSLVVGSAMAALMIPFFESREAKVVFTTAAFGLLLAANAFAWHRWVLRPMRHIEEALVKNEAALHRALEDRTRLGRDLHDGIAQSLYAAGMDIAGLETLLRPDQPEARARLERARAVLNETMCDLRNLIDGLEPEALKRSGFSKAVAELTEFMQGVRPFRATLEIDEALAAKLSLPQRVHVLQIAREALSNALRHGQAGHVHVSLRPEGALAVLAIVDDGRGFNGASVASRGNGLKNFSARARDLGAEISVDSAPGQGTHVKLVLSPHTA